MEIELRDKQPLLKQMEIETDQLVQQIASESKNVVEPKKHQVQREEEAANQVSMEAETIKLECENDLMKT